MAVGEPTHLPPLIFLPRGDTLSQLQPDGRVTRLLKSENAILVLLVFAPVALVLRYGVAGTDTWVFITSAIAVIPLAGLIGRATEHLAEHVGAALGGLLNATFGNAAELIIAIIALREGYYELVKASITGSIIGNILLVFGLSALLGGIRYQTPRFNRTAASLGATMLLLAAIALVVPAIFHMIVGRGAILSEHRLSLLISVILIVTYLLSLLFSLRTHSHLYTGVAATRGQEPSGGDRWSRGTSVAVLLAASTLVGLMSELLVGSVEHAAEAMGMNEVFIGVILVAMVGNAAEHSAAVLVALKNKMDLSINIAIGSSLQVALFVAPALVFLSYIIGPEPLDLLFTPMEVVAVGVSVGIMEALSQDGETHWMEGVQLLAVYAILAVAFFFLPG
jgi:Ca2+:H+ antiporter